jgi:predicted AAA+ superfamily ATPase
VEGLGGIHEDYYGMYPEKRHREKVYFFFDEIQIFPQW